MLHLILVYMVVCVISVSCGTNERPKPSKLVPATNSTLIGTEGMSYQVIMLDSAGKPSDGPVLNGLIDLWDYKGKKYDLIAITDNTGSIQWKRTTLMKNIVQTIISLKLPNNAAIYSEYKY